MPLRLKLMAGVLAALALLLLLDRPTPGESPVSEVAPRAAPNTRTAVVASPAGALAGDVAVPDLFAAASSSAPIQAAAAPAEKESEPEPELALLGFKEEDGVREAYLQIDGDVLSARAGAELKHRYRVLALRQETVDIRDAASGSVRRIGFKEHNE